MKKLIAVLMLLCVAVMPFAGLAEAAEEITTVNWEDVAEIAETIEGDFYTSEELAVAFWLPAVFEEREVPASEDESTFKILNLFATADDAASIAVTRSLMGDDIAAYVGILESEGGASNIEEVVINGLYAISYDLVEQDAGAVFFPMDDGTALTFVVAPVSDEGFAATAAVIMASFQLIEQ